MRSVGAPWAVLLAFGLAWPLACGGHSRTTPGDPDPSDAGNGSGGSSSLAGTKAMPTGGSSDPGAGGGAPAGGMESGGMASGGVAVGMAGSDMGGVGGMPLDDICSSGGASLELAPPDPFAGTKNEFGFALKDSYFLTPCLEVQGHDCLTELGTCPNQDAPVFEDRGRVFSEQFQLGGCLGKMYSITFKVNGIVEGKYYQGGTRRRAEDFSNYFAAEGTDAWYVGGKPTESGYNVFKLAVLQPDGTTEVQHYYLNSFPEASGLESYVAVPIGYEATIDVPGQGVVRFTSQDSNCRAVDNCGPEGGDVCSAARNVPNEPGLAVPPVYGGKPVNEQFNVVNGANQPFHAQMVHVSVTKVELKP